jgi:hypothetical protein
MSGWTIFDEEMLTTAGNTRLTTLTYPRDASDRETTLTVGGGFSPESVAALTAKKPMAAKDAAKYAVADQRRRKANLIFIFATS